MALYNDPSKAAQQYTSQIPGTITPYFQPYINAGQQSLGALGNQYSQLLGLGSGLQSSYGQMAQHPGQLMNQIGSGYQQSPGYQWQLSQGQQAVGNAAASGGYVGTPQEQQYDASMTEGLANQDYYNYMNHVLGIGKTGLQGEQGMYNQGLSGVQGLNSMGYGASSDLASGLSQALMQQANLAYAGTANQNQHRGGLIGDTLGLVGSIFGGKH